VGLLPLTGDDAVPSFVVVVPGEPTDGDGIPVSAVVRGALAVDVFSIGGSRRFTDRDIRPWLLADFQAVVGLVIGSQQVTVVPVDRLDAGTPIGVGVIAAHRLFWSLGQGQEPVDDTVLRDAVPRLPGTPSFPDADTVILLRNTQGGGAGPGRAGRAGRPSGGIPAAVPRYGFRVAGQERRLDAVYYLGRRPRAPRITDTTWPHCLVAVDSRTFAVSATHVEIRQEGDSVVVTDLGSTNGTIVTQPRGKGERLRRGGSLAVVPGTTVDIGDGNIIEILAANGP
jgi:hypothetical protein